MRIEVRGDLLVIGLTAMEKLWSLHGSFAIPLSHVTRVHHDLPPWSWKELRIPGTSLPGVIKAGSYYTPRGRESWYVTRWKNQPIVLELHDERYKRLVLGIPPGMPAPAALSSME